MLDSEAGFVYVLTHPRFPELVKIGFTSRLVEERIADLSTAVPEDFTIALRLTTLNARTVERYTHELLGEHRFRKDKEFFEVTEEQACAAVHTAAEAVNGIRAWASEKLHRLQAKHRVFLPLRAGQHFVWLRYTDPLALLAGGPPSVVDIWEVHSEGDVLELHGASSAKHIAGFSDDDPNSCDDPVPYLNRTGTAPNGDLLSRERLLAGDRLVWLSVDEQTEECTSAVFEVAHYCQAVYRTWNPQSSPEGFPLFPTDTLSLPSPPAQERLREILNFGPPRSWSEESLHDSLSSRFGIEPQPPAHWLPPLGDRRGRSRRRSGPSSPTT